MKKWLLLFCLISHSAYSSYFEVENDHINYQQGKITVDYQLTLAADTQKVKDLLQNYENFPEISRLITKSNVLKDKDNNTIIQQQLRPCLLGICYQLNKTQRLSINQTGYTSAIFTPQQKYFQNGYEQWQISEADHGTRIHYSANIVPAFSLPPLIGNLLVRHFIEDEINYMVEKIHEKCL